jgi:inosine-uridine nucleoside N-ribohydrolase
MELIKKQQLKLTSLLLIVLLGAGVLNAQVKIIFDTDIGGDADDLGALFMLHHMMDNNECEILGVASWSIEEYAVPVIDALNRYHNHPNIPIGTRKSEDMGPTDWNYNRVVAEALGYKIDYHDVPDAVTLYRKILSENDDNSLVILTVGPLKNIEDLLQSSPDVISDLSGKELVEKKVKEFVIMGGQFPSGDWEWNFNGGMPGVTKNVIGMIETPITFLGYELGVKIKSGEVLNTIDSTLPLYLGYLHFSKNAKWMKDNFKGKILDNSSYDQTAVLYAVRNGIGKHWTRVTDGKCVPNAEGGNTWVEEKGTNHSYLVLKQDPEAIATLIESLMLGKDE